jgi:hypothetical protein
MLKSEEYISCNACHICDGELYEGWRAGCEDLVFRSGAEEALEAKEYEIKKKAVEAFRQFVEDYCNESGRKDIAAESEHYLKIFNELINA